MKIDNGTGGSRETSTGKPARVDERGRESINFVAELRRRMVFKVGATYLVGRVAGRSGGGDSAADVRCARMAAAQPRHPVRVAFELTAGSKELR